MRVEIITRLGEPPIVLNAGQIVVYDCYDNPLMVGVEYCQDQVFVSHAADDDFNLTLKNLNIPKTVVCTKPKLVWAGKQ